MVFILAMVPVIALCILAVYNVSISTREKMKLQNTADATTYSASVLVARNLNYLAYTNRAMAANEASVAFVASLQTSLGATISAFANVQELHVVEQGFEGEANVWARNAALAAGDLATAAQREADYWRNVAQAQVLQAAADRIGATIPLSAIPFQLTVDAIRFLNEGISLSQEAMMAGTVAQIPDTVYDVLKANDPSAKVSPGEATLLLSKFIVDTADFVRIYSQGGNGNVDDFNDMMRFAHVAQAMRDDFTKSRRILPKFFVGLEAAGLFKKNTVRQLPAGPLSWRGGTELVASQNIAGGAETGRIRWQSGDNIDVGVPVGAAIAQTDGVADATKGRFGLGAAAAVSGVPGSVQSWQGHRLAMPSFYTRDVRSYGGLTSTDWARMDSDSFYRAATGAPGLPLIVPMAVHQYNSRFTYGPSSDIGLASRHFTFPRYVDVRDHAPMYAGEADGWLEDVGLAPSPIRDRNGKNDYGPTFSLVVEKGSAGMRTAQNAGFGSGDDSASVGLKDRFLGDRIKALSSAEIYFKRPQDRWARRDHSTTDTPPDLFGLPIGFTGGYVEHKSLFSPYWQVRNVQPSIWARTVGTGIALAQSLAE